MGSIPCDTKRFEDEANWFEKVGKIGQPGFFDITLRSNLLDFISSMLPVGLGLMEYGRFTENNEHSIIQKIHHHV